LKTGRKEKMVHVLFNLGMVGKGVDGVLEIVGGVLLFLVSPSQIYSIVRMLAQHELSEDPHDLLAGYLIQAAHHLSVNTQIFAAVYLVWHGIVKVGLVIALLQKRLWAYPAAIVAFVLFLVYQVYRYTHTHSPWLLVLSVIDLFVIVVTWLEYKRLRVLRGFA
jgi:uncharacterized membrane protein